MPAVIDITNQMIEKLNKLFKKENPYNVILHNDDNIWAELVLDALMTVIKLDKNTAYKIMMTAHSFGKAVVVTCSEKEAKSNQEKLEQYGLTISIEEVNN